ncbi:MAG: hypothetical protein E7047_05510 [Lentisphaerae bacterium]|nr:hypothetical protein [Lentisphaerota bacterium]
MAAEIPNLVKRNGIYYFRCRIPSNLTNGRAREVKISLKTGDLTSDLLDVILKVTDYSRRVIVETVKSHKQGTNLQTALRRRLELPQVFSGAQDSRDSSFKENHFE